jgi:hypothetical protein
MHIKTSFTLFVAFFMAQATAADQPDLRVAVTKADESLFAAVFDSCDPVAVAALTVADFEFIHDKWGQIAKSRDEFVKAILGSCERQKQGTDFKATRRLIKSSIAIYRMKDYGALQTGEHQFYRVEKDGTLSPTEYAKFTHLWREEKGRLLLAKVISYAHFDGSRPGGTQ